MSGTLGGGAGGPLIAGYSIPIKHQEQHHENACWATCLAMVLKWAGEDFTKEAIFTDAPNIIPEYRYGDTATLTETNYMSNKITKGKVTFQSIEREIFRKADAEYWIAYINKFKPILFSMNNHCRILMGYNGVGQLLILDPAKETKTQPEPMGIGVFRQGAMDVRVMK